MRDLLYGSDFFYNSGEHGYSTSLSIRISSPRWVRLLFLQPECCTRHRNSCTFHRCFCFLSAEQLWGQCTPAPVEQRRFPKCPVQCPSAFQKNAVELFLTKFFHKLYKVNVTVPFVQTNHSAPSLSIYRLPFRVGAAGRKDGRDLFCCCDHLCLQWCPQLSIADDANWNFFRSPCGRSIRDHRQEWFRHRP